jgi:hypothetical protein
VTDSPIHSGKLHSAGNEQPHSDGGRLSMLGVISITIDSDLRKGFVWDVYGEGLASLNDASDIPIFSPGNLVVFNVDTKRYGDVDQIMLGRKDANSEWEVISYGR